MQRLDIHTPTPPLSELVLGAYKSFPNWYNALGECSTPVEKLFYERSLNVVKRSVELPQKEGESMEEFRVFLPPAIAGKVKELVDEGIYNSPSAVLRDIVRDWYKKTEGKE